MIERRYQYWGPYAVKMWTPWFEYDTDKSLQELRKLKPANKKLLEEYREINGKS